MSPVIEVAAPLGFTCWSRLTPVVLADRSIAVVAPVTASTVVPVVVPVRLAEIWRELEMTARVPERSTMAAALALSPMAVPLITPEVSSSGTTAPASMRTPRPVTASVEAGTAPLMVPSLRSWATVDPARMCRPVASASYAPPVIVPTLRRPPESDTAPPLATPTCRPVPGTPS